MLGPASASAPCPALQNEIAPLEFKAKKAGLPNSEKRSLLLRVGHAELQVRQTTHVINTSSSSSAVKGTLPRKLVEDGERSESATPTTL